MYNVQCEHWKRDKRVKERMEEEFEGEVETNMSVRCFQCHEVQRKSAFFADPTIFERYIILIKYTS